MPFPVSTQRHSLSHVLAAAVLRLFPSTRLGTGPDTETGFYYDFQLPRPLTAEDLPVLEQTMRDILAERTTSFAYRELPVAEAIALLKERGQDFKVELVEKFVREQGIDKVSFYRCGEFEDLCEGPHVAQFADIDPHSFTLNKIAGAYWQADSERPMMTRIYGLAFSSKAELEAYQVQLAEAEKRDHRKLGREMDLFTFSELVGPGLPLFTPKGTAMRNAVEEYLWQLSRAYGYQKVDIPHVTKPELYKVSGHWDKYSEEGFHVKGRDKEMMLKPMNCPHHTQIYASQPRSYRDLPVRYFEVTKVYRDEQSGELLGLSRVLSITQDDGHCFCRPDQIEQECGAIVSIIRQFYDRLGMLGEGNYSARLSVRDPKHPEKFLGDPALWDVAEAKLAEIAAKEGLDMAPLGVGEAAFYGPKIDFMFKDAIGRQWQLATIQLDFVQPERFQLEYTAADGTKQRPVMIHRAISGSLERFLSVIIEHFAGDFPVWMAPVQVRIIPVNAEKHGEAAASLRQQLHAAGLRVEADMSENSLGKRIREANMSKIPLVVVLGDKELESGVLNVNVRGAELPEQLTAEQLIEKVKNA